MSPGFPAPDLAALRAELAAVPGTRAVGLGAARIGRGALAELPGLLAPHRSGGGPVALLTDGVPKSRAGADLDQAVSGLLAGAGCGGLRVVTVPAECGRAHADPATLDDAAARAAGAAALVSAGSGTVADIGKAVSARLDGLPHAVVQTALSVNGYADDQSVLLIDGVKRTTPTRWPQLLIADTDVLACAPAELNAAGVGDMLAMFTAPADWWLAGRLGMTDGYLPGLAPVVTGHGPHLLRAAPLVAGRDPAAVEYLAWLLTLSGVCMGAAGSTAPASGPEHAISHLIEMAAARRGEPAGFHGAQVGIAAVLAALAWQHVLGLLAGPGVRLAFPAEDEMAGRVAAAFAPLDPGGAMGAECWRLYRRKLARWAGQRDRLAALDWAEVAAEGAARAGRPEDLAAALAAAGAPSRFSALNPPQDPGVARWALASCYLMRDRFTVVDLAFFLGAWDDGLPGEIWAGAAALGAGL